MSHPHHSTTLDKLSKMAALLSNGYVLGLDLGIASVGWALLDPEGKRFVASGSRTWTIPENPKDRTPNNVVRRESRLQRNLIRHKRQRLSKTRLLFVQNGLIDKGDKNFIPRLISEGLLKGGFGKNGQENGDQWTLRAEALNRMLTGPELTAALYHIANHRGYRDASKEKSNNDPEGKAVLGAIAKNQDKFAQSGFRTAGEWIANDPEFTAKKRNSDGSYVRSITRDMLREEAAKKHIQRLMLHLPPAGSIRALQVTDKQYARTKIGYSSQTVETADRNFIGSRFPAC